MSKKFLTYAQKKEAAKNSVAQKLLGIIDTKKTNLCVSLDVTSAQQLLALADLLGPEICLLKTHIDIVEDFSDDFIRDLLALANEHRFMIFEDRKFADIGNTVQLQYSRGVYHISEWADIVNAHIIPGPGTIEALRAVGINKKRALLLLAEMSSVGSLATGKYTKTAYEWAEKYDDFVIGFIGTGKKSPREMLVMTPGVNMSSGGDVLGQHYQTPQQAIETGSDVIIVGRGIYADKDPLAKAKAYRAAGWEAYQSKRK